MSDFSLAPNISQKFPLSTLDLSGKLREDPAFAEELAGLLKQLHEVGPNSPHPNKDKEAQIMLKIWKLCNLNPGLLVPFFYPQYPNDKPLSLAKRMFAYAMMEFIPYGYLAIRGSRQIGKSTTFVTRQRINSELIAGFRSIYVAPHINHRDTYAQRFVEMERSFRYYGGTDTDKFKQNQLYKEYPNKSTVRIVNCWTDTSQARSKTTDELLYDEYQLFDDGLESDVAQCQRSSELPCTIYAGTSTTLDSPLEKRYVGSSAATWFIRNGDESDWLDMGDKDTVLKMISPKGLVCPKTGKLIDPSIGQFVHHNPKAYFEGRPGYHISQLMIPDFVNDPLEWGKLWRDFNLFGESKFLQENLGLPVENASKEITENDLIAICNKEKTEANILANLKMTDYLVIMSGMDWGGSDYQPELKIKTSYTVHVVCGIKHNGSIEILHMKRYSGMNYRDIVKDIGIYHRRYKASCIGSDMGGGQAYNMLLRENNLVTPERHFVFNYTAPNTRVLDIPRNGQQYEGHLLLNKTEALTILFDAIKRKIITCYNWEEAKDILLDVANITRVIVDGEARKQFRYQRILSKSDDMAHALAYITVMTKLYLGLQVVDDPGLADRLKRMLHGVPQNLTEPYTFNRNYAAGINPLMGGSGTEHFTL